MKKQIFLIVSYIIAFVSFNFDVFVREALAFICAYVPDEYVIPFGPRRPGVTIHAAMADGATATNRMRLIYKWVWNDDMGGISIADIPAAMGVIISIAYTTPGAAAPRIVTIGADPIPFGELILP